MDGIYSISISGSKLVLARCDMTLGGWTTIMRRHGNDQDFNLNWNSYVKGFGNPYKDYWIGLEAMHEITKSGTYQLWINMRYSEQDRDNYAIYDQFAVSDESQNYRLTIGSFMERLSNVKDDFRYEIVIL